MSDVKPHLAKLIEVNQKGQSFSIVIDGEVFPWFTTGGASSSVFVERNSMPGVTITIVAERVTLDHDFTNE